MSQEEKASKKETKPVGKKITLSVSNIKADLKAGLDRQAIGEKYGLLPFEVKQLFQNPALKGLKVKKAVSFELVDDTVKDTKETAVEEGTDDTATEEVNTTKEAVKETTPAAKEKAPEAKTATEGKAEEKSLW